MEKVRSSTIREIAHEIARGNTCYLHRNTKKITTIDHSIDDSELMATQEKVQAELEKSFSSYIKLEKLNHQEQRAIMDDFAKEFQDKTIQKQLSNALSRKNPVRNFNQIIENDMELRQHWLNFNKEEYFRWVTNFIDEAYFYGAR